MKSGKQPIIQVFEIPQSCSSDKHTAYKLVIWGSCKGTRSLARWMPQHVNLPVSLFSYVITCADAYYGCASLHSRARLLFEYSPLCISSSFSPPSLSFFSFFFLSRMQASFSLYIKDDFDLIKIWRVWEIVSSSSTE